MLADKIWGNKKANSLTKFLSRISISTLLFSLIFILTISVIIAIASKFIMGRSLAQQKMSEHVLFEVTYGHNFIVRDVDVTLRGFALIHDERYLYRSNEYIRIDLERNFARLDSLLKLQHFSDTKGRAAIERYKEYIRAFVTYHGKQIDFIRNDKQEEFSREFYKDVGAYMWPVFVGAVEAVNKFETELNNKAQVQYRFFSFAVVYIQGFTLLVSVPIVLLVLYRLKNEKRTAKLLEERKLIDERNRAKENMLSVMSHEIRTPLNSMIGLTHALKRNPKPEQVEIINTLSNSGDHLLHLVNDILDYNKMQAKGLELELINFNLREILQQLRGMFVRLAEDKGLQFNVQVSPDLPIHLKGDSTRLTQILSNLVGNAIKFTSQGKVSLSIESVKTEGEKATIEFRVEDTGIGISAEKMPLIFNPFMQLDARVHRKYGGTGLGLLIVKNLTELMRGDVKVESVVEQGTIVHVIIPFEIQSQQHVEEKLNHIEQTNLQGIKVLYVEDVESNRFLLNTLMEDHQIKCMNAEDGTKALSLVSDNVFDIILLDIQLPDKSGYEVADYIRHHKESKNHATPIILFSAYTGISEDQIRKSGANDLISKPFNPNELFFKIRKYVKV